MSKEFYQLSETIRGKEQSEPSIMNGSQFRIFNSISKTHSIANFLLSSIVAKWIVKPKLSNG